MATKDAKLVLKDKDTSLVDKDKTKTIMDLADRMIPEEQDYSLKCNAGILELDVPMFFGTLILFSNGTWTLQ